MSAPIVGLYLIFLLVEFISFSDSRKYIRYNSMFHLDPNHPQQELHQGGPFFMGKDTDGTVCDLKLWEFHHKNINMNNFLYIDICLSFELNIYIYQ